MTECRENQRVWWIAETSDEYFDEAWREDPTDPSVVFPTTNPIKVIRFEDYTKEVERLRSALEKATKIILGVSTNKQIPLTDAHDFLKQVEALNLQDEK